MEFFLHWRISKKIIQNIIAPFSRFLGHARCIAILNKVPNKCCSDHEKWSIYLERLDILIRRLPVVGYLLWCTTTSKRHLACNYCSLDVTRTPGYPKRVRRKWSRLGYKSVRLCGSSTFHLCLSLSASAAEGKALIDNANNMKNFLKDYS